VIVRRSELSERLCLACAEGARAVALAAESESRIRRELYPELDRGAILRISRGTPARL
jgi:hypothetical protein